MSRHRHNQLKMDIQGRRQRPLIREVWPAQARTGVSSADRHQLSKGAGISEIDTSTPWREPSNMETLDRQGESKEDGKGA